MDRLSTKGMIKSHYAMNSLLSYEREENDEPLSWTNISSCAIKLTKSVAGSEMGYISEVLSTVSQIPYYTVIIVNSNI